MHCCYVLSDQIWVKSGREFYTLLKKTPCCNAGRWPDIIHPDRFFFSLLFQTHNPTLDWQGPVVCHLLAMFGSGACISCSRCLLLGPPSITHSDAPVIKTVHQSIAQISAQSYSHLYHTFCILHIFTTRVNQSWHFKLQNMSDVGPLFHVWVCPKLLYFMQKWFSVSG